MTTSTITVPEPAYKALVDNIECYVAGPWPMSAPAAGAESAELIELLADRDEVLAGPTMGLDTFRRVAIDTIEDERGRLTDGDDKNTSAADYVRRWQVIADLERLLDDDGATVEGTPR